MSRKYIWLLVGVLLVVGGYVEVNSYVARMHRLAFARGVCVMLKEYAGDHGGGLPQNWEEFCVWQKRRYPSAVSINDLTETLSPNWGANLSTVKRSEAFLYLHPGIAARRKELETVLLEK